MIAIIDYGLGNLASVRNAFRAVGSDTEVTSDLGAIGRASGIVLPGVGAASAGMQRLRERGLDGPIRNAALAGKPLLGLCLGMQMLFDRSEEGDAECLGLIPGTVSRLQGAPKVPHIGWNRVVTRPEAAMWHDLPSRPFFYFVHSFVCEPADPFVSTGSTDYGVRFCSAVTFGSIWGTQFHPERSSQVGLQFIKNYVDVVERRGHQG